MALSLTQLEAMETALETAIATGARKVQWGNKTTEYHSMKEMTEALDWITNRIADLSNGGNFNVLSGVPIDS